MRVDNIIMAQQLPVSHMTEDMYLPNNRRYEDMTPGVLKRALCQKNIMKDWHVCQACTSGCKPGNLLVGMMTGQVPVKAEPEKPEPTPTTEQLCMNTRKATTKQLMEAKMAILHGEDHDEVVARYGYANWINMKRAMKKAGIAPPLKRGGVKRGADHSARTQKIRAAAAARIEKLLSLLEQGMDKQEAAKAVGYSNWNHAREAGKRQGVKWE